MITLEPFYTFSLSSYGEAVEMDSSLLVLPDIPFASTWAYPRRTSDGSQVGLT
jgi:hypothetical protein